MNEQPADSTAVTKPTVVTGMGYPNGRNVESPTPIGWQGLDAEDIEHVSRETVGRDDD